MSIEQPASSEPHGSIEQLARVFVSERYRRASGLSDAVVESVDREIGLTLSHIQQTREEHRSAIRTVSDLECGIGTELLQMQEQQWWYTMNRHERWRDGQGLRARLAALTMQRLSMESAFAQRLRANEERLLVLVHRRIAISDVGTPGSRRWS